MICTKPDCSEKESCINGYCSIYCRDMHDLLKEMDETLSALSELYSWVKNWDCPFLEDEEWSETEIRVENIINNNRYSATNK